jgi:CheY-like chemotaxis protein
MSDLKRILLAEDNAHDIQLTLAVLAENNLANEVMVVRDGVEALDYLRRRGSFSGRTNGQPAVIFLDIKMPRMDGVEVLREIKTDAELQMIPVVMVTSSREQQDLLKSYRLGVNAYVVKPIDFRQFSDAIKQLGLFWAVLNEPPPEGGTAVGRSTEPPPDR